MLNPEKTFQSILRKFKTLTDFEKRKIVFWYDKDRTADEGGLAQIGKALGERGIKHMYWTTIYLLPISC